MAERADEWPSLAPIRTSCSSSSSSSRCYYYIEPNTTYTHNSSLPQKADHYQSPPSSSSSHLSFLHSSTTVNRKSHSFLSKCFPPRPNSAFPKQCLNASPRRDMRRPGAAIFRSVTSFPAPGCAIAAAAANVTHSGPLNPGQYSGPLKSSACKSHLANMHAFTMIPANVVGKKKPPDYISDEPTSPEVTCIGRVRSSKHSKSTWDALFNSSEKLCKRKKTPKKQIECSARRNLDHDLQLAYIPRPLSMASSGAPSRWISKMISLLKGLPSPYVQRKLRQEDLVIDLSRLRATCSAVDRSFDDRIDARETSNGILYICQAGEGDEDDTIMQEEDGDDLKHADAPQAHPNCLLLMHNMSGRSKVFHNLDDSIGNIGDGSDDDDNTHALALKVIGPPADQKDWNKMQVSSFLESKKLLFSSSRTIATR